MSEFRRSLMMKVEQGATNPWERYNQDGLVFQLDCEKDCSADNWLEIKNGYEFVGNNITLDNGVPYFNGTNAYMKYPYNVNYPANTHTIEACFYDEKRTSRRFVYCSNGNGNIAVALEGSFFLNFYGTPGFSPSIVKNIISSNFGVISYNMNGSYQNKEFNALSGSDSYSILGQTGTFLGTRPNVTASFWKGKIYSVRIYNRLLTEDEMLANQEIDMQRFQNR